MIQTDRYFLGQLSKEDLSPYYYVGGMYVILEPVISARRLILHVFDVSAQRLPRLFGEARTLVGWDIKYISLFEESAVRCIRRHENST